MRTALLCEQVFLESVVLLPRWHQVIFVLSMRVERGSVLLFLLCGKSPTGESSESTDSERLWETLAVL